MNVIASDRIGSNKSNFNSLKSRMWTFRQQSIDHIKQPDVSLSQHEIATVNKITNGSIVNSNKMMAKSIHEMNQSIQHLD